MLRSTHLLLSAPVLALLTACAAPLPASIEAPVVPDAWRNLPATAPMDAAQAQSDLGVTPTPAPNDAEPGDWWRVYESDELNALVEQALQANHDVKAAGHRVAAAHTLNSKAWATFWPKADFRMQGARDAAARDNFLQSGFDVMWPLTLPVEREGTMRLAQGQSELAVAESEVVRATVAAEVVRTWLQARHAARALQIEKAALASTQASMRYLDHRAKTGLVPADAPLAERLKSDERQRRIHQLTAELHELAQSLAVLLGRSAPDPGWFAADATDDQTASPTMAASLGAMTRVPTAWLAQRQDVVAARARLLEAAGDADVAQAALYPRAVLGVSWIYSKNITRNGRQRNEAEPMIAPFIDIPLFDWGIRTARRDARRHALQAAIADYHQTLLSAYAQTEIVLNNLDRWQQEKTLSQQAVSAVHAQLQRAEAGARAGTLDRLELEQGRRMLGDAQLALSMAHLGEQLSFAALHRNRLVGARS